MLRIRAREVDALERLALSIVVVPSIIMAESLVQNAQSLAGLWALLVLRVIDPEPLSLTSAAHDPSRDGRSSIWDNSRHRRVASRWRYPAVS